MKQYAILALFFFFANALSAQCISGDCKNGTGIYLYPSGAKYIGQFKDNEIHGIGTCYYTDGSTYRGEWAHRFQEGHGIKTLKDGRTWEGTWKMGLPTDDKGQPIANHFPEKEPEVQTGCLAGDCENGEGTFAYAGGSKYVGQFKKSPFIKGVRRVLHGKETAAGHCLDKKFIAGVRLLGALSHHARIQLGRPHLVRDGSRRKKGAVA